ncbi:MAG TPA: hypothetical protein VM049_11125 [Gaiellaceae bacterium]|nr:hypothetical protein [Gaiellaceae bacterium]
MNKRMVWVVAGALVGVVAAGPSQSRSEASTGPATITINDRQLAVTRVDLGARGTSPGDVEIVRTTLLQRVTRVVIGHGELVCTFVDTVRSRVCRGTYFLPKGKLVVGGSILYRQFYDLAVLGGTGLYDNARGTLTVTRTHRRPVRDIVVFRLVG